MSSAFGPLLRLLRVPPEPHLPAGDPSSARVFRAGANYWRLKLLGWSLRQAITLFGLVFALVMLHAVPDQVTLRGRRGNRQVSLATPMALAGALEAVVWAIWLVQLPIAFAILRLDYDLRWYIVTDRAARLREGILGLKEMTFTLANVQDIRIQQGPLQRLLGLADVELRTAGGSDAAGARPGHRPDASRNLHLARFRGVENAELIRDLVVDRMKKARGAGLGDPEDAPAADRDHGPLTMDVEAAAREMAEESRRLRTAVARLQGG